MSSLAAAGFARYAAPRRAPWVNYLRRLLGGLLAALDRLVPPNEENREPEPPPEWSKYPPF